MKRTIKTILCAAAAVLAAVSCQKSTEPVQTAEEGKGTIEVRVNGLMGEYNQIDATKAELVNTIRVSWKGGETVYVYDGSNCIGSLVASLEGTEDRYAVLSTDGGEHQIETPAQGTQILTLVYSPLLTEKQEASHDLFISLEAQSGEKAPFVAYATLKYKGETTITGIVVPFKFATSVIKVNCTGLKADTAIDQVTLSNVHTNCWVNIYGDMEPSIYGYTNGTITRTGSGTCDADQVNGEGEAVFQIAVPELYASEARVLTVAQGSDNFEDKKFTTNSLAPATSVNTVCQLVKALPAGALPGVFSVSATKKVYFSKGNLWADSNKALHFEDAQWKTTPASDGTKDASHVSHFTWSSTVEAAVGDSNSGDNLFCDESHKVSIDGGEAIYYALSSEEWQYLFAWNSALNEGNGDFDENLSRYGLFNWGVTVCDKANCVVLLPDNWDETVISLTLFATQNTYDESSTPKWSEMQAAGAVCLPAAGFRVNTEIGPVGVIGRYWSSTADDSYDAYYAYGVDLNNTAVYPDDCSSRSYGYSVRLITEAK